MTPIIAVNLRKTSKQYGERTFP